MPSDLLKALFLIAMRMLLIVGSISSLIGLILGWLSYNRLLKLANRSKSNSSISISLNLSPNKIGGIDLILLSFSILLKYLPLTKGYKNQLKSDQNHSQKFQLPLIKINGNLKFDQDDLKRFQRAIQMNSSISKGSSSPSHNEEDEERNRILKEAAENNLFLVALTAPLVIYLLAQHDCPIKPLGAVNTKNVFHYHDPTTCRDIEGLLKSSQDGELKYSIIFGGKEQPGIRKKRGMEFEMKIEIRKGERLLLTQNLSFLQFLKSSVKPKFDPKQQEQQEKEKDFIERIKFDNNSETCALPRLDVTSPRLWASSCGDYNPIHILPLAAILFGFPSVIAHGNHILALSIESVFNQEFSDFKKAQEVLFGNKPLTIEVQFVKPMVLPATLYVSWQKDNSNQIDDRINLIVLKGERPCILGACYHDV